jgi:hypothetical protein
VTEIRLEVRTRRSSGEHTTYVREEPVASTPDAVEAALHRLDGAGTTILTIEHDGRILYAAGGPDLFNVLAALGDDEFYDLVGDRSLRGWARLVMGGQLTRVPRRHLVTFEAARSAALEFLATGTVRLSERWERQGRFEEA